jgi:hypothetical protein
VNPPHHSPLLFLQIVVVVSDLVDDFVLVSVVAAAVFDVVLAVDVADDVVAAAEIVCYCLPG